MNAPQPNGKLKAAREARGWKAVQVALFLELSDANVYRHWEGGIRPNERNISRLCALFRKSREELGF